MPIIIIGGVTAVGKTSTAKKLKELFNWNYIEADQYHSISNINKMKAGIPLTDEDRLPWLLALHEQLKNYLSRNESCIMTCSALKKSYRKILLTGTSNSDLKAQTPMENIYIFMLTLSTETLSNRLFMRQREHFMNPTLLDSQIHTLELPIDQIDEPYAHIINCDNLSEDEIAHEIQMIIKQ